MNLSDYNKLMYGDGIVLRIIRGGRAQAVPQPQPSQHGHKMFGPFFVKVSHPAGSTRAGVSKDGLAWSQTMHNDYGELPGSVGNDGDPVDCYLGPQPDAKVVHVIHTHDADGNYDEDKAMLGFPSQDAAVTAFKAHYPPGSATIGSITSHRVKGFRKAVRLAKNQGGAKLAAGARA